MNIYTDKELIENIITGIFVIVVSITALVLTIKIKKTMPMVKALQKAIVDLRAKGELNEEKFDELKERFIKNTAIISTITLLLCFVPGWVQGGVIGVIFILIFGIIVWLNVIKVNAEQYLLYTIGVSEAAYITWALSSPYTHLVSDYYTYTFLFHDKAGVKYDIQFRPHYTKLTNFIKPQVNDKINILYLEDNPEIATPFFEHFNKKFNLRKD
jgi:hypothetical protein